STRSSPSLQEPRWQSAQQQQHPTHPYSEDSIRKSRRRQVAERSSLRTDGGRKEGEIHIQSWRKNNLNLFIFMQSLIRQESPEIYPSIEQKRQLGLLPV